MGFGLGLAGGGAVEGLQDILKQRALEQELAERHRAAVADEALRSRQLDMSGENNSLLQQLKVYELKRGLDRDAQADLEKQYSGIADSTPMGASYQPSDIPVVRATGHSNLLKAKPIDVNAGLGSPMMPLITGGGYTNRGTVGEQHQAQTDERMQTAAELAARRQAEIERENADRDARTQQSIAALGARTNQAADDRQFTQSEKLSTDWQKALKPVKDLNTRMAQVDAGLAALNRGDRGVATQTLIYSYNKLLDDISSVREGEYARSEQGASLMQRILGTVTQLTEGGAKMTDDQLRVLAQGAKDIGKAALDAQDLGGTRDTITRRAKHYGISLDDVFGQNTAGLPSTAAPPPPGATPTPTIDHGALRNKYRY